MASTKIRGQQISLDSTQGITSTAAGAVAAQIGAGLRFDASGNIEAKVVLLDRVGKSAVSNVNIDTTFYSKTIPGNTLGTTKTLHLVLWGDYLQNTGVSPQYTLNLKFGGTTFYSPGTNGSIASSALNHKWKIDLYLSNDATTSAQLAHHAIQISVAAAPGWGSTATTYLNGAGGSDSTFAEDTTGDLDLVATIKFSTTTATQTWTITGGYLELIG